MHGLESVVPALARAFTARGYDTLTSVQAMVLAPETADRDLLVSAQTGSGKTVAFGMAMAPGLLRGQERFERGSLPQALVVAPTRELALQVCTELTWLYEQTGARVVSCVGGMDMRKERQMLSGGAHIVIGTPGRLRDHIERGSLDIRALQAVVLDEADEMLDLGFREDLEYILSAAPPERRTLLFSATVPQPIAALAKRFQRDALRLSAQQGRVQHGDIEYRVLQMAPGDRENAIINLLRHMQPRSTLIFCGTRMGVNHLTARLANRGFVVVALSGELNQASRGHALQAMRDGRARICVATDVAARGIDLPDLELVIHADLPTNGETLLHRSGRTGRAGRKGLCALMVPYNRRQTAQRLLAGANIRAEWGSPPSAADVAARDRQRMLEDAVLQAPLSGDEPDFVQALLAAHPPEQIAAAYLRLQRASLPAPEELSENLPATAPAAETAKKPREAFSGGVWFSISAGHKQNAEPRWLLPLICRVGNLTRRDIGAIKVFHTEANFEVAANVAERFWQQIEREGTGENLRILRLQPGSEGEASKPRKLKKPEWDKKHRKKGGYSGPAKAKSSKASS
jgi:ATP-dependent RNA helicase DeaD